ncbi:MAG: RNA methyltransferase [Oscillospiraceae bacterium]|nr:RNA methyltransferase [Oscillospiraceae bacterium]
MEKITSRKDPYIRHVRQLAADGDYRRERGEYLCDGVKTLREALAFGAKVTSVLWKDQAVELALPSETKTCLAPADLFDYASPMRNSPGPLFTVAIRGCGKPGKLRNAIVLESVQDPGNVGTVIRTANAFGINAVILTGESADLYNPKTVRATMGAIFRQKVLEIGLAGLVPFLADQGLPLYGAALDERAADLRSRDLRHAAVAVGSEGRGLSAELLAACDGTVIIPMEKCSESLNAAIAAAILMWETVR